ncbi:hypothetical protein FIBSPDRAFT_902808 [Athelia psychrophila]|uniref:Uncharacterized protein n=1 Tax=Athelia psychrophila TaxID=1759441 RepID=A0A167WS93_9AGAM|nr:hypothetical protein FIBSPDRAFT_902808 [Fibularhizoctonia sp. CBS 109695]
MPLKNQPLTGPPAIITKNTSPSAQTNSCDLDLSSNDQRPRKRARGISETSQDTDRKLPPAANVLAIFRKENTPPGAAGVADRLDHEVAAEGQAYSDELSYLRARVKQLEETNETLRRDCARYRVYWIAECRLKDLMEAGHYTDAISQPRWTASSPERDYNEDAMEDYCVEGLTSELER